ncbi:hypothetical protein ACNKHV_06735 [Shigella flexneri]
MGYVNAHGTSTPAAI